MKGITMRLKSISRRRRAQNITHTEKSLVIVHYWDFGAVNSTHSKRPATNWMYRLFSLAFYFFRRPMNMNNFDFFLFHWHTLLDYKAESKEAQKKNFFMLKFLLFDFDMSWSAHKEWKCNCDRGAELFRLSKRGPRRRRKETLPPIGDVDREPNYTLQIANHLELKTAARCKKRNQFRERIFFCCSWNENNEIWKWISRIVGRRRWRVNNSWKVISPSCSSA